MAHVITTTAGLETNGLFARIAQAFADYRLYRETYDELNALTERELNDLGISRFNIRDIARDAAYSR